MRALTTLLLAALVSSSAWCESPAASDADSKGKPTSFWMEKKMDYAQAILRGLASSDFESIGEGARQMRLLNKVEGFVRKRNPSYQGQLRTFEQACDEMIRQSDKQNLPGVTLAFNQLTISCVNCHETLRTPQTHGDAVPDADHAETRTKND